VVSSAVVITPQLLLRSAAISWRKMVIHGCLLQRSRARCRTSCSVSRLNTEVLGQFLQGQSLVAVQADAGQIEQLPNRLRAEACQRGG
jgi:hypothetical protein